MNQLDTIDLTSIPFYQWDSVLATRQEEPAFAGVAMLDSVFAIQPDSDTLHHTSIFTAHELAPANRQLIPRPDTAAPGWVFALIMLLVAATVLYVQNHKLRIGDLLSSIVNQRAMDRLQRNHNLLRPMQLLPAPMLAAAAAALPTHCLAMSKTGFLGYILLVGGLIGVFFLRNALMRLTATVFGSGDSINPYLASNCLFYLVLDIALLPLSLLFFYMPGGQGSLTYIIFILILIEFLARIYRGLQLFLTHSSGSRFFIFYYLCIVELAPILVLTKWLIE